MSNQRFYLAGAVELVHPIYAKGWRAEAKRIATEFTDLTPVDPLDYEDEVGPYNDEQIVNTDRHLLANCDAVLMDGRQPGWGTGMELAWANHLKIPVIVWGVDREQAPVFLRYHATIFERNLPDAVLRVAELSLP
jgi:nucleoside 2-deoxyribosyltransferase